MRSKKTLYNISSSLILQFVILISGFIVPKLIIKTFGSNVNGLVSSITQFLSYIMLLESGMGPVVRSALYKPLAINDKKMIKNILRASEKFFRTLSFIFLVYLVILAIVYPFVVIKEFEYVFTMSLVLIISISTFAEYYFGMAYKLFLQANGKTYVTAIIQIITYILNIILIVILVKLNFSIQGVKIVSGVTFVLRPILQNIYVRKKYDIDLKNADDDYKLQQKWDGLAQHIAAVIHNNTDITVLTFFNKLSEVSVYSVYHMVTKGIKSIVSAFTGGIDASFGDMIAKEQKVELNKKFTIYEIFYYTVVTIFYACTLILIVPFINVYTKDIVDVNYIRPLFGYLLVISELTYAIRLPYSLITLAAGHFKQTRRGAWIEALVNIILSVGLVIRFGISGVAIGTLIAMLIRTVEFVYHTNKFILERSMLDSIKKILIIIVEFILIIIISYFIPFENINTYSNWFGYAILIFIVSSCVTIGINCFLYQNDFKEVLKFIKKNKKH